MLINSRNKFFSYTKYILLAIIVCTLLRCIFYTYIDLFEEISPFHDTNSYSGDVLSINDKYTIRINTFRRNEELKKIVRHYTACPHIEELQIIWSDLKFKPPPLSFFQLQPNHIPVRFEIHNFDSLSNRFLALSDIKTETIYSTDDDVIVSCDDMTIGFSVWLNSKVPMVGFSRRSHYLDSRGQYVYAYKEHVHLRGEYSMVLTKNAFFSREIMAMYNDASLAPLRKFIDHNRNCEDVLLSFIAANATGRPAIYVQAKVTDLGEVGGISSGASHKNVRNTCVTTFVNHFGRDPLVFSPYEVRRVRKYNPSYLGLDKGLLVD